MATISTFGRTTTYRKLDHDSKVLVLPVDSTITIMEGCPCYWDSAAKVAKPIPVASGVPATDDAIAAMYCGIAQASTPVNQFMRAGVALGLTKMSFYIGQAIVKVFYHVGEAVAWFTPVYAGDQIDVFTATVASRTEPLGYFIIDVDEYKIARTSTEGEEVSTLMRKSIFDTYVFSV